MTIIIDYGVGNLFSLKQSLAYLGEQAEVSGDPKMILSAKRVILPGVGAFGDAAERLRSSGLFDIVKETAALGAPLLGICLGMQLLFDRSFEFGEHTGLGLIGGEITPIEEAVHPNKVPHIGWNALNFKKPSAIYKYISENEYVYFVHSFAATGCEEYITATTEYGAQLTASAERRNIYGTQFHPEKSGDTGLRILKAFLEI